MSLLDATRGEVLRRQVARDVDVALLQQQALRGRLLHVPVDDARQLRLLAVVVVVALERHDLVGAPLADLERTGAGVVGLEPAVAEVVVRLLRQHELLVDDRRRRWRSGSSARTSARRPCRSRSCSVNGPVCLILSLTLSLVKPNWVRMNAGVLSSSTARCSENTTSSAVSGLPDANLRPGFSSNAVGLAVGRDRPGLGDVAVAAWTDRSRRSGRAGRTCCP